MKKGLLVRILLITTFIIIASAFIVAKNRINYDINESPSKYSLSSVRERTNYTNFIKKYLTPSKLNNFLNVQKIHYEVVKKYASGIGALNWFKYEAYTELFYQLFDKNRNNFDDCPVTENFKQKFKPNVFHYYKFNDAEDSSVNCGIDDDALQLSVNEAGDFIAGEPGYIYYHHFHYTLDEEGNVDDIIFDYTE